MTMSTKVHFLNVMEGDCSIIEHDSGRITVIDICNGNVSQSTESLVQNEKFSKTAGNFHMKDHPTDPIAYMEGIGVSDIFRMIVTHPDMDHMDGLERLFKTFNVVNFWTTENDKGDPDEGNMGRYKIEDWWCYKRNRNSKDSPTALQKRSGATGDYWTKDGITILTPTAELIRKANDSGEYNISSYSFLHTTPGGHKILFGGDTEDDAWNHILENYRDMVSNVDVLIAPHHGRKTGGNDDYLDVLKPKLTLLGNAKSRHLDYASWNIRNLLHITNNEAGNVMVEEDETAHLFVYLENQTFARRFDTCGFKQKDGMYCIGYLK